MDRTRRFCEEVTDILLALYGQRVHLLGSRLNVAAQDVAVFAEGRIRASLIFQLSKVSQILIGSLRAQLHQEPYDVLVPGRFVGKVAVYDKLEQGLLALMTVEGVKGESSTEEYEPVLVCARTASGDEEVAGVDEGGRCAAGLVVGHDIPILSHLGEACTLRNRKDGANGRELSRK